jgi:hypothetical protein
MNGFIPMISKPRPLVLSTSKDSEAFFRRAASIFCSLKIALNDYWIAVNTARNKIMKFLCLSYLEEKKLDLMSASERETFIKECFAYDNILRKNGNFVRLEALLTAQNAKTLRYRNGKASVTDGPYAETKEQIRGYSFARCQRSKSRNRIDVEASGDSRGDFRDPSARRGSYS